MQARNLIVLVLCQLITATGTIVVVTLGGIIGSTLTTNKALATLPMSLMVLAVAATTIPATMLMRRIGRRRGFMLASLCAVAAMLVAALALAQSSFVLFIAATMLLGINMAFTQQYRYAAAESVRPEHVSRAVSFVLIGPIGGALIGPVIATRGHFWIESIPYAGTMLALAALFFVQACLFLALRDVEEHADHAAPTTERPLG